jgi:sugar lactone lactonase YvrE
VAQGADGFLYVGTLAFGAYFASGHSPQSKVYRINPALSNAILTESDVWASGLYPITGCGFGPGGFYVTEYFTASPAAGALIKIALNPDGSAGARTIMGGGRLQFPNGFAAGPDGSVYVSNHSTSPGIAQTPGAPVGEVVRVDH